MDNKQLASAPEFLRGALFQLQNALEPSEKGPCILLSISNSNSVTAVSTSPNNSDNLSPAPRVVTFPRYQSICNTKQSNSAPTPSVTWGRPVLSSQRPLSNNSRGTPLPHLYCDSPPLPFLSPFLALCQCAADFTPHCHVDVFLQRLAFVPSLLRYI